MSDTPPASPRQDVPVAMPKSRVRAVSHAIHVQKSPTTTTPSSPVIMTMSSPSEQANLFPLQQQDTNDIQQPDLTKVKKSSSKLKPQEHTTSTDLIALEGYLHKEAEAGMKKKWNQRWVYVKGTNVYYINKKKKLANTKTKIISGRSIIRIQQSESSGQYVHVFEIQTMDKICKFCAATQDEYDAWLEVLSQVMAQCEIDQQLDHASSALLHHVNYDTKHFAAYMLHKMIDVVPQWKTHASFINDMKHVLEEMSLEAASRKKE